MKQDPSGGTSSFAQKDASWESLHESPWPQVSTEWSPPKERNHLSWSPQKPERIATYIRQHSNMILNSKRRKNKQKRSTPQRERNQHKTKDSNSEVSFSDTSFSDPGFPPLRTKKPNAGLSKPNTDTAETADDMSVRDSSAKSFGTMDSIILRKKQRPATLKQKRVDGAFVHRASVPVRQESPYCMSLSSPNGNSPSSNTSGYSSKASLSSKSFFSQFTARHDADDEASKHERDSEMLFSGPPLSISNEYDFLLSQDGYRFSYDSDTHIEKDSDRSLYAAIPKESGHDSETTCSTDGLTLSETENGTLSGRSSTKYSMQESLRSIISTIVVDDASTLSDAENAARTQKILRLREKMKQIRESSQQIRDNIELKITNLEEQAQSPKSTRSKEAFATILNSPFIKHAASMNDSFAALQDSDTPLSFPERLPSVDLDSAGSRSSSSSSGKLLKDRWLSPGASLLEKSPGLEAPKAPLRMSKKTLSSNKIQYLRVRFEDKEEPLVRGWYSFNPNINNDSSITASKESPSKDSSIAEQIEENLHTDDPHIHRLANISKRVIKKCSLTPPPSPPPVKTATEKPKRSGRRPGSKRTLTDKIEKKRQSLSKGGSSRSPSLHSSSLSSSNASSIAEQAVQSLKEEREQHCKNNHSGNEDGIIDWFRSIESIPPSPPPKSSDLLDAPLPTIRKRVKGATPESFKPFMKSIPKDPNVSSLPLIRKNARDTPQHHDGSRENEPNKLSNERSSPIEDKPKRSWCNPFDWEGIAPLASMDSLTPQNLQTSPLSCREKRSAFLESVDDSVAEENQTPQPFDRSIQNVSNHASDLPLTSQVSGSSLQNRKGVEHFDDLSSWFSDASSTFPKKWIDSASVTKNMKKDVEHAGKISFGRTFKDWMSPNNLPNEMGLEGSQQSSEVIRSSDCVDHRQSPSCSSQKSVVKQEPERDGTGKPSTNRFVRSKSVMESKTLHPAKFSRFVRSKSAVEFKSPSSRRILRSTSRDSVGSENECSTRKLRKSSTNSFVGSEKEPSTRKSISGKVQRRDSKASLGPEKGGSTRKKSSIGRNLTRNGSLVSMGPETEGTGRASSRGSVSSASKGSTRKNASSRRNLKKNTSKSSVGSKKERSARIQSPTKKVIRQKSENSALCGKGDSSRDLVLKKSSFDDLMDLLDKSSVDLEISNQQSRDEEDARLSSSKRRGSKSCREREVTRFIESHKSFPQSQSSSRQVANFIQKKSKRNKTAAEDKGELDRSTRHASNLSSWKDDSNDFAIPHEPDISPAKQSRFPVGFLDRLDGSLRSKASRNSPDRSHSSPGTMRSPLIVKDGSLSNRSSNLDETINETVTDELSSSKPNKQKRIRRRVSHGKIVQQLTKCTGCLIAEKRFLVDMFGAGTE